MERAFLVIVTSAESGVFKQGEPFGFLENGSRGGWRGESSTSQPLSCFILPHHELSIGSLKKRRFYWSIEVVAVAMRGRMEFL